MADNLNPKAKALLQSVLREFHTYFPTRPDEEELGHIRGAIVGLCVHLEGLFPGFLPNIAFRLLQIASESEPLRVAVISMAELSDSHENN